MIVPAEDAEGIDQLDGAVGDVVPCFGGLWDTVVQHQNQQREDDDPQEYLDPGGTAVGDEFVQRDGEDRPFVAPPPFGLEFFEIEALLDDEVFVGFGDVVLLFEVGFDVPGTLFVGEVSGGEEGGFVSRSSCPVQVEIAGIIKATGFEIEAADVCAGKLDQIFADGSPEEGFSLEKNVSKVGFFKKRGT